MFKFRLLVIFLAAKVGHCQAATLPLHSQDFDNAIGAVLAGSSFGKHMFDRPYAVHDDAAREAFKIDALAAFLRPLMSTKSGYVALRAGVLLAPWRHDDLITLQKQNRELEQDHATVGLLRSALSRFAEYEDAIMRIVSLPAALQVAVDPENKKSAVAQTLASFRIKADRANLIVPYQSFLIPAAFAAAIIGGSWAFDSVKNPIENVACQSPGY